MVNVVARRIDQISGIDEITPWTLTLLITPTLNLGTAVIDVIGVIIIIMSMSCQYFTV